MITRRLAINLNSSLASRITSAVEFSSAHCIYPPSISIIEMTSAQVMMITVFHSLLYGDMLTVQCLLSFMEYLPQIRSTFIGVWLRDDFTFRRKDVAKVLSTMARFIQSRGPVIPDPILTALTGLEEKYDIFNYFIQCGDVMGQQLLAYVNPLVTRATQVESEELKDHGMKFRPNMQSVALQTTKEDIIVPNLPSETEFGRISEELDGQFTQASGMNLTHGVPPVPPRRRRLRRSSTLPISSASRSQRRDNLSSHTHQVSFAAISKREGELRLLAAVEEGNLTAVEQELYVGANPNCQNRRGVMPLHLAASKGHSAVLSTLLTCGATVNARTHDGWTALHMASYYGHVVCTKVLLDSGADPILATRQDITPFQMAIVRSHHQVAQLIVSSFGYNSTEV